MIDAAADQAVFNKDLSDQSGLEEEALVEIPVNITFDDFSDGSESQEIVISGIPADWDFNPVKTFGDNYNVDPAISKVTITEVTENNFTTYTFIVSKLVKSSNGNVDIDVTFDPKDWTSQRLDDGTEHKDGAAEITITANTNETNQSGEDLTAENDTSTIFQKLTIDINEDAPIIKNTAIALDETTELQTGAEKGVVKDKNADRVDAGQEDVNLALKAAGLTVGEIVSSGYRQHGKRIDMESDGTTDANPADVGGQESIKFTTYAGQDSGLNTTSGDNIYLFSSTTNPAVVFGIVDPVLDKDGNLIGGTVALTATIDSDLVNENNAIHMYVEQYESLEHLNENSHNEKINLNLDYFVTDDEGDKSNIARVLVRFKDDGPAIESANAKVVIDDDNVPGADGSPGGIGDDAPANTTGILSHNYGADEEGATTLLLDTGAPAGFIYEVNDDGTVLTVKQNGVDVMSITLDDTTSGNYTVTQLNPIKHPEGSDENNVEFVFNYRVTDGDKDTVDGTLSVSADDDTPVLLDTQDDINVSEEDLPGGVREFEFKPPFSIGREDAVTEVDGNIKVSFGADGAKSIDFAELDGVITTFKSGGEFVAYQWNVGPEGTGTLTAWTQPVTGTPVAVFTLEVTDAASGAYTFKQLAPVDHSVQGEDNLAIDLAFTVTDGDNDTATGSLTVNVSDDTSTRNPDLIPFPNFIFNIDEDGGFFGPGLDDSNLGGPGDNPFGSVSQTVSLVGAFGADGVGSLDFANLDGVTAPVTSGEEVLTYSWVADAGTNGGTLTASYVNGSGITVQVFTVVLNANTDQAIFTLLEPIDHNPGNDENNEQFILSFTRTDFDGDTVTESIVININDDTPVVQSTQNDLTVDIDEADVLNSPSVTGDLAIDFGADGPGTGISFDTAAYETLGLSNGLGETPLTYSVLGNVLTAHAGSEEIFTLSIDPLSGTYNFTLKGQISHPAGEGTNLLNLKLPYFAVDGDGDSVSAHVDIAILDHEPAEGTFSFSFETANIFPIIPGGIEGAVDGGFEDWKPNQNQGNTVVNPMKIVFDFMSADNEVIDSIDVTSLPAGTILYVGGFEVSNIIFSNVAGSEVGTLPINITGSDINQVYLKGAEHSDVDIPVTITANISDPDGGLTAELTSSATAIIDATADKPVLSTTAFSGEAVAFFEGFENILSWDVFNAGSFVREKDNVSLTPNGAYFSSSGISNPDVAEFLGVTISDFNEAVANNNQGNTGTFFEHSDGTAIQKSVFVSEGQKLTFDFSFFTTEFQPDVFNDSAFIIINGEVIPVAQAAAGNVNDVFEYTFTSTGEVTLGIAILNEGGTGLNPTIILENLKIVQDAEHLIQATEEELIKIPVEVTFPDYADDSETHQLTLGGVPNDWILNLEESFGHLLPQGSVITDFVSIVSSNVGSDGFSTYVLNVGELVDQLGGTLSANIVFDPQDWTSQRLDNGEANQDGPAEVTVIASSYENATDQELTDLNDTSSTSLTVTVDISEESPTVQNADIAINETAGIQTSVEAAAVNPAYAVEVNAAQKAVTDALNDFGLSVNAPVSSGYYRENARIDMKTDGTNDANPADISGQESINFITYRGEDSGLETINGDKIYLFSSTSNPSVVFGITDPVFEIVKTDGLPDRFAFDENGHKILLGGTVALTATLDAGLESGTSSSLDMYVEQHVAIDHPVGSSDQFKTNLVLDYFVTDDEGDKSNIANINVRLIDSAPEFNNGEKTSVDEADNTPVVTGNLGVDFSADGSGTAVSFDIAAYEALGLTSGGNTVLSYTASGNTLIARVGAKNIFTLTIDPATGKYIFTLKGPLDHTGVQGEALLDLKLPYITVDGDGDPVSAIVEVTVKDKQLVALNDVDSITENSGLAATGNVITGMDTDPGDTNDTDGQSDNLDNAGLQSIAWNNVEGTTVKGQYGTLTFKADGSYSYQLDEYNPAVNSMNVGDNLQETFTYTVTDGDGDSDIANLTIDIHGANDAPEIKVVRDQPVPSYTENGDTVQVFADLAVSDVDNSTLSSATVTVSNFVAGDILGLAAGYSLPAGMSTNYDPATGVLTLTGISSHSEYETVLENVAFSSTSENPDNGGAASTRTVTVKVNDGSADSILTSTQIDVTGVNDAPVIDFAFNTGASGNSYTHIIEDNNDTLNNPLNNDRSTAIDLTDRSKWGAVNDARSDELKDSTLPSILVDGKIRSIHPNHLVDYDMVEVKLNGGEKLIIDVDYGNPFGQFNPGTVDTVVEVFDSAGRLLGSNNDADPNLGGTGSTGNFDSYLEFTAPTNGEFFVRVRAHLEWPDGRTKVNGYNGTYKLWLSIDDSGIFINDFTEDGTAIRVFDDLVISDVDDSTLSSATVIVSDFVAGDVLGFAAGYSLPAGMSVVYDPATGVLVLSGEASLAEYEAVLEKVRYSSTSDNPDSLGTTPTRTITVKVNDANDDSTVISRKIGVIGVNDAPEVEIVPGNLVSYTENSDAVKIFTNLNVVDDDSPTLSSAVITISNFVAGDVLWFAVGYVLPSGVTAIYDPATGALTMTGIGSRSEYETALENVVYKSTSENPDVSGTTAERTLTIKVNDGSEDSEDSVVTTTRIGVTGVNDAPVAMDDIILTNDMSGSVTIPDWVVLRNDSDVDSNINVGGISNPSNGSIVYSSGGVNYTFAAPDISGLGFGTGTLKTVQEHSYGADGFLYVTSSDGTVTTDEIIGSERNDSFSVATAVNRNLWVQDTSKPIDEVIHVVNVSGRIKDARDYDTVNNVGRQRVEYDHDTFRVTLKAGETFNVKGIDRTDLKVELFANNNLIDSNLEVGEGYTALSDGDYYIRVSSGDPSWTLRVDTSRERPYNIELEIDSTVIAPVEGSYDYTASDGHVTDIASVSVEVQKSATITGTNADEILMGGANDDILLGNGGNDTLIGGVGNDTLIGGDNADIFIFTGPLNSSNKDTVSDYNFGQGDALDVSDLVTFDDAADSTDIGKYLQAKDFGGGVVQLQVNADGLGNDYETVAILQGLNAGIDNLKVILDDQEYTVGISPV
ncbi:DUF5801 repeats-in-toxin domain-containing protein [Kiloniella majae]|uniref:DUF5801 repeats-in-toxin domain-containing protein n=1 Tax=Kiloniella majae TaxID=1938558 RepID=UPI001C3F8DE8|nr:DUF5801 repeats-in-toxin domain-containing protein [Kiloniella majae]